jgi:group I intron endonuclease
MIIYKVTNLVNNKVYIGKTVYSLEHRKKQHISDAKANRYNMLLHRAIMKYGEDNFCWEILDKVMFSDLLMDLEKFYIKKYKSRFPNGYNLTDGGEGITGHKHSKETRKKMSESHKGIQAGENNHFYGRHPWNYGTADPNKKSHKKKISGIISERIENPREN